MVKFVMFGWVVVVFVLLLIAELWLDVRNLRSKKVKYCYSPKGHIMTRREERLFRVLNKNFENYCYVVPQVHLSALLNHEIKGQNWKGAFSHINGKSVDFVLIRREDLSVVCAVELDDSTHNRNERAKRDKEVERIFEDAKVPLIRLHTTELTQNTIEDFMKIIYTST